jgi:hypothetical protein
LLSQRSKPLRIPTATMTWELLQWEGGLVTYPRRLPAKPPGSVAKPAVDSPTHELLAGDSLFAGANSPALQLLADSLAEAGNSSKHFLDGTSDWND